MRVSRITQIVSDGDRGEFVTWQDGDGKPRITYNANANKGTITIEKPRWWKFWTRVKKSEPLGFGPMYSGRVNNGTY